MARLIAFGCSHTLGPHLPDNENKYDPATGLVIHSNLAWPHVLGNKLKCDTINLGFSGAGNQQIFNILRNFEFKKDDICVVMWSHFLRHDNFLFEDTNKGKAFSLKEFITYNDIKEEEWKKDNYIKNWLTIEHATLYLEKKNIEFYQTMAWAEGSNAFPMPNVYLSNFIRLNTWKDFVIDYASDYMTNPPGHAGVKSHMLIGDKLYYGINKIRTDRTQSTKILNVQYNHSSI